MKKILLIILILLLTGCTNYKELNNYAIVTGMSIDKYNEQYEVSILIANGVDKDTSISVVSGIGDTIYSAIKDISLKVPKELYLTHLNIVIISEDIASTGITPILDFLVREPESHQIYYLAIARNSKGKDILSVLDPISDYPSQNISSNIKSNNKLHGRVSNDKVNQFIGKLLEKGIHPILNTIIIEGNKEDSTSSEKQSNSKLNNYIKLDNLALFKNDKLVDYSNDNESIGINILLDTIDEIYIDIPYNESNIILSSNNFKNKTDVSRDNVNINIDMKVKIAEVGCNLKLNNKNIKEIEDIAESKVKEYINDSIILAKKNKADIFGYGTRLYKKDYKYFNKIKDWDEYFTKLKFNINVDVKIIDNGSANNTIGVINN